MIFNKKTGKIISREERFCYSLFSQLRGLMFSKRKNLVFVFDKERNISLHNWFVFFPIDVLFLDSKKQIVEIKKGLRPFGFYFAKKKARYIVELGEKKSGLCQIGDILKW
ncbi:DUF192 domain-containing protein [Candidatus Woesearchaeota archaeon]|nr:DUF192 domain-containing protein [Candidatus Woesearchaeota archaeon]HLC80257.1 DUF192 domain-containing protein [Candidatus Nanoarchaeia archaeon]